MNKDACVYVQGNVCCWVHPSETATPTPQKAETPFLQKRLAMLLTECGVTHCAVLPLSRGAHGPKTPRALSHFFHLPATSTYISAIATCPGVSLSQLPPIASVVTLLNPRLLSSCSLIFSKAHLDLSLWPVLINKKRIMKKHLYLRHSCCCA